MPYSRDDGGVEAGHSGVDHCGGALEQRCPRRVGVRADENVHLLKGERRLPDGLGLQGQEVIGERLMEIVLDHALPRRLWRVSR